MNWQKIMQRKGMLSTALVALLALAYMAWAYTQMPGAMLYVHNHTDRPIFSYSVNEAWGGNASAYGGGGASCCSRIEGDVLTVEWIKGRTGEQVRQGVQKETVTLEVPNPSRTRQDCAGCLGHRLHCRRWPLPMGDFWFV